MTAFRVGRALAFAALFSCCACGVARQNLVGYPLNHQRVSILIKISDQVNAEDDGGGVATLAETVSDKLKENGIDSQIYTSKYDRAPPPRIELNVLYWHGTSTTSRKLAAAGYVVPGVSVAALATSGNRILVDCAVFAPDDSQPVFRRRLERSAMGIGLSETDGLTAASDAGSPIVNSVLTAEPKRELSGSYRP